MTELNQILGKLPHGEPFRFVDALEAVEPGVAGCGRWDISGDEDFFRGHFPEQAVVPGVLIAEALAQLSGIVMVAGSDRDREHGVLAHTDLRFRARVEPPAVITLHSRQTRMLGTIGQYEVRAEVDGRVVAEGTLAISRPRNGGT